MREAAAAAGGYADCIPECASQVCCQSVEFLWIRVHVGEHFDSMSQELGSQSELDLFSVVGQPGQIAGRFLGTQVAGLVVGACPREESQFVVLRHSCPTGVGDPA
ncbi:hypothetical protein VR43_16190 [Streptomyces sp. NRRL S-104]|nr:hypothetical protein VR43_16190 [Streptomyces sp. NRRL S-104]